MGNYKQSEHYLSTVTTGRNFQERNSSWSGTDAGRYASQIKYLVEKYNAKTLLDYGCGKGNQYPDFAHSIGLNPDDCYLYDPCVKGLDKLPETGRKFDAIILIQVIGNIPSQDLETWVKELLETTAAKFIFIGEFDPMYQKKIKPIKSKKLKGYRKEHFKNGGYCNNIDNTKYWTEVLPDAYFYFARAGKCNYPLTLNANKWWTEDVSEEIQGKLLKEVKGKINELINDSTDIR